MGPRALVLGALDDAAAGSIPGEHVWARRRLGSSGRKANCRRGDQGDLLASGLCSAPDGGAGFMGEGATLCKQGRGDVVMARAGRESRPLVCQAGTRHRVRLIRRGVHATNSSSTQLVLGFSSGEK